MKVLEKKRKKVIVNMGFSDDINFINKKLLESEVSPTQSLESAYLEGWKK